MFNMIPMLALLTEGSGTTAATSILGDVITSSLLSGVFDEIVALIPTVLPVLVGFLAVRKGISFVLGMLRSA